MLQRVRKWPGHGTQGSPAWSKEAWGSAGRREEKMIALTAFHCWQVAWQMGGEWRREGEGWDWSQCREPGRLGEGRRTGGRGQGIGSWKGASASFAVKVESDDFGRGREEAAQVFVLQGGPEALETPSSASAAPQTCHLHVCLSVCTSAVWAEPPFQGHLP